MAEKKTVDTKTFTVRGKEYKVADYVSVADEKEIKEFMNDPVVENMLGSTNYKNLKSLFEFIGYDNEDVKWCIDIIVLFGILANFYLIKLSIPSSPKSDLTSEEAKDYLNKIIVALEEDVANVQDAYEEYLSKLENDDITEEQVKVIEEKIEKKNKSGGMTPEEFNDILNKTRKPINKKLIIGIAVSIVVVLIIVGIIIAVAHNKKNNNSNFNEFLLPFGTPPQSTKL